MLKSSQQETEPPDSSIAAEGHNRLAIPLARSVQGENGPQVLSDESLLGRPATYHELPAWFEASKGAAERIL